MILIIFKRATRFGGAADIFDDDVASAEVPNANFGPKKVDHEIRGDGGRFDAWRRDEGTGCGPARVDVHHRVGGSWL
jgi:hypothetical protein